MADAPVFFIAEAGVNHNGSVELALELIQAAARSGADAVKFQTFDAESVVSARAGKALYQIQSTGEDGNQLEMLRALQLPSNSYRRLADQCRHLGIAFMSTAFDLESLRFLATFDMPATKIPSGDVTAGPLLLAAARLRRPLIVSTGMCTLPEIEEALGVIAYGLLDATDPPSRAAFAAAYASREGRHALARTVTLLHCVTEYPAPYAEVNLKAMDAMREHFRLPVGYSDHSVGTCIALAAVARGATVIEKHFTMDRNLRGPDHAASLEPEELAGLVRDIRYVESALGVERKAPTSSELRNRIAARRSLVAAEPIARGQSFTERNLAVKRPGDGMPPIMYWDLLGVAANRDYAADEAIEP
jgi:N-acetylneuraminate synthase